MRISNSPLKRELCNHYSGNSTNLIGKVPAISKKHYRIIKGVSVGGDAPKELVRIYEYEQGIKRADKPNTWPIYIVKTGHKYYPIESITEHLLNRIGQEIGLKMAESRLCYINGQLRFMSRLFRHSRDQMLVHGADLYSGYLGDKKFVEEIEEKQLSRQFFTVTFTYDALRQMYPHQAEDIFFQFVHMLVFDALVGNNDRHYYNWGILKNIRGKHQPEFSPIYDTARALFWNTGEAHFSKFLKDANAKRKFLEKYTRNSKPKTGVEKNDDPNHRDLIAILCSNRFENTKEIVEEMIYEENRMKIDALINNEFAHLLSEQRRAFITECLSLRFDMLKKEII